ncbi:hypothetical protein [uncultured Shimia sp.]|uniref:hypothetical protein n=1 Tax=uncultured Shimia sp. TaxID=573152 RepID=UPI00260864A7|nr:hypothetical protein [uncultured Shimia sp.]
MRRTIGRLVCLFASLVLGNGLYARCGLPQDFMALVDSLYVTTLPDGGADSALAQRLGRDAAAVDMKKVSSKLFSLGLSDRRDRVDSILNEAQSVAQTGRAQSPCLLREKLKRAERLNDMVCNLERIQEKQSPSQSASDIGQKQDSVALPFDLSNLGTTARIAGLLMVMGALVTFLFVLRSAWSLAVRHFNSQRTCRVSAAVEQGLDVIDGHITVLGKGACRFRPVNEGAYDRVVALNADRTIYVIVAGHRLPTQLSDAHGVFVDLVFSWPLISATQCEILEASRLKPQMLQSGTSIAYLKTRRSPWFSMWRSITAR